MKKLTSILVAIFTLCGVALAQTNSSSTNNPFTNLQPILGSGATATLGYLVDAEPYLTNNNVLVEVGALKSGSQYGWFGDLQVPLNTNSWQMSYGVSGAYVNKSFYSGALNVSLGTSMPIPLIGNYLGLRPVYLYVESGPGYNFRSHQFIVQSFAGIKYIQPLGFLGAPKWSLGGSYGLGIISDISPKQQEFSLCLGRGF